MANPFFSGRIPQELYNQVDEHIQKTGESKTQLLINALCAYLNLPVEAIAPPVTNSSEERFKALEERVAVLEKLVKQGSIQENNCETDVISTDNEKINTDEKERNESLVIETDKQANEDIAEVYQKPAVKPNQRLKTNEIPNLPGLEDEDPAEIKTRLRNARSLGKRTVKVGPYLFSSAGKELGRKGALLWRIIEE